MDRKPLVASKDYGKDETKAEVLLKKHEAVELDIEGFGATITHLNEKAVMMIDRGHFDRCVCVCGCVFMFLVPLMHFTTTFVRTCHMSVVLAW